MNQTRRYLREVGISRESCIAFTNVEWPVITLISLAISLSICALVYMGGHLLDNQTSILWAKNTLEQIIFSGVIIVFLIITNVGVDILTKSFGVGDETNNIDRALELSNAILITLSADLMVATIVNFLVTVLSSTQIVIGSAIGLLGGFSFSMSYVLKPIVDMLNMVVGMMTTTWGIWFVNLFVLCFSKKYLMSFLLPIGIFFRTFSFTRALGGALIAIALGFYVVYPAMINVSASAVERYYERSSIDTPDGRVSYFRTHLGGDFFERLILTLSSGAIIALIGSIIFGNVGFVGVGIFFVLLNALIEIIKNAAYFIFIVGVMIPVLIIYVTFTAIREFARHFGTDVNIGDILRVL
ncbi:MAG: hypothetical protein QXW70_01550 [Candidatus Anstonellales archaeon]